MNRLGQKGTKTMYSKYVRENILKLGRFGLQLFAEGDDGSGSGDDGNDDGSDDGGNDPMSFDDFLKLEGNQAELDKRISKAVKTAVENAKRKWDIEHNDSLSEAEKLAKMTKEEKAIYQAKKLEARVAELEKEKSMSEMTDTARKLLNDEDVNGLDALLPFIVADDAEATSKNVKAVAEAFKNAVAAGIRKELGGSNPQGGNKNTLTKEQILKVKDPIERQRLIAENIGLFE